MDYGCIAQKLGHSFSGEIHKLIGDYDYRLKEVLPDELDSFMREHDFLGINVTIPYKKNVIPYLYDMSDIARRIGSVNTVVNRDGKLYGYNTDYYGMKALCEHAGVVLDGKKVLILGTGGTSATAHAVAEDLGSAEILTVSRRRGDGTVTYDEAISNHADAEVIINTTPVGMYRENYASPIPLKPFKKLEGVIDAVFNPLRTELVLEAQSRGIKAEGGLYMLVAQAVYASEFFRDVKIPKSEIERIYSEILKMKTNIALTGMPACGKTATARIIAKELGREFIDIDEEIVRREKTEITEIFAQKGESGFRDIETEVLKDVCRRSGVVISTGGGAVLRFENVRALNQNCKVFFLDRPLEWLTPTADRPTASSKEAIEKRYTERHGIYLETADEVIKPTDIAELNAKMIIERFFE